MNNNRTINEPSLLGKTPGNWQKKIYKKVVYEFRGGFPLAPDYITITGLKF